MGNFGASSPIQLQVCHDKHDQKLPVSQTTEFNAIISQKTGQANGVLEQLQEKRKTYRERGKSIRHCYVDKLFDDYDHKKEGKLTIDEVVKMLNDIFRKRAGTKNMFTRTKVAKLFSSLGVDLAHGLYRDDFYEFFMSL